jgi:predicted outer membrane repeat protein
MKLIKSCCSLLGTALLFLSSNAAPAAIFNITNGDVAGLTSAITTANSNGQDDTIELAAGGTYTLTARDSFLNGLPQIGPDGGHKLTIHGNGATIQRIPAIDDSAHKFRIFETKSGANVTLTALTLTNGNLSSGTVAYAGAIYNNRDEAGNATLTIANCTITNCSGDYGGAIYNDGSGSGNSATLIITNSTFSGNFSNNNGGAIFNDGQSSGSASLTITGSTFSQNSNSNNDGGAIQQDGSTGTVTGNINNSTFSGNSSAGNGGAIYIDGESGSATLNVSNCTFNENSAVSGGNAIYNTTGAGGSAVLQLGNTIFATGAAGDNLTGSGGTITSQGYNLCDDAAGGPAGTAPGGFLNHVGDKRNTDPLLDSAGLKNNGGATMTIALQAISPALDQGKRDTISLSSNDQRGVFRPFDDPNIANASGGDGSDIGAYEADVRNTNEERIGNDLRLTFTTSLGRSYEVQHAISLSGSWTQVPGTVPPPPIAGTGGIVQVTVPNAFSNPGSNFYRVHELP